MSDEEAWGEERDAELATVQMKKRDSLCGAGGKRHKENKAAETAEPQSSGKGRATHQTTAPRVRTILNC